MPLSSLASEIRVHQDMAVVKDLLKHSLTYTYAALCNYLPRKIRWVGNQGSKAGSVFQNTGTVEFEDGLRMGVLVPLL